MGVKVVGELYVDMDYAGDGSLLIRRDQYAHEANPREAAQKIITYLDSGKVRAVNGTEMEIQASSICVHGDTRNAPAELRVIREELKKSGVEVTSIRNFV